jgi:hypothetical protein
MLYKLSLPLAVVAFTCVGLLSACQRVEPVTEMQDPSDMPLDRAATELTFRLVAEGTLAPVESGEHVYRDAEEWRAVRQGLRRVAYEPSLSMEGVLLAALDFPTGGYRVRFDSVYVTAGHVAAIYTIEEPGPECMVTQALTQPFQAIAVPNLPGGPVRFVQRRQTYSC